MKKFFLSLVSALAGICLAVTVHCAFMTVEEQSSAMLPDIEPGQKVLVYLLAKDSDIHEGDIVAFESPYYTVGGENGILLRKVSKVSKESVVLSCGANMTQKEDVEISRDDILGKAVIF